MFGNVYFYKYVVIYKNMILELNFFLFFYDYKSGFILLFFVIYFDIK